ncbi:MAG: DUF58 domain-containing protein [Myxococcales bacterium]|nr:DUF58 domain-containing protein [Myxococcales bacterium]
MSSLLDPDFLRRLARLRVLVRRRFAGTTGGARRSSRRGASVEFADHRAYVPGDEFRRIDWNAYARLEELVLRLYVAEEDLALTLFVDRSASLGVGSPPKLETSKRVAAALAYVALSGSERISLIPFGEGMDRPLPPTRGKGRIGKVLRRLDELEASGETSLSRSVEQFLSRRPRPGLVCVISDFLDREGYQRPIDRLLGERHEASLFHILDTEELDPQPGSDLSLLDSETGARLEVSLDARALDAYRRRVRAFLEGIETYARRRGLAYVQVGGKIPFEEALLNYLRAA